DDIDVHFPFENFCDPPLVVDLSLEAERGELIQDFRIIARFNKNVDVLCGPAKLRVCIDGKSARHHECEFGLFEDLQDFSVEGMSRGLRLTLHNSSIEKVNAIQGIYRAAAFCLIYLVPALAHAQICRQWTEAVRIGELQGQLIEESGLAASRQ